MALALALALTSLVWLTLANCEAGLRVMNR
jgi:hypothetical protein